MKRILRIAIIVLAVLMTYSAPSQARGGHGGGHGHGFEWGPALGLGLFGLGLWEATRPRYYQTYPAERIYVQPVPQQPVNNYWYYCREPEGYYPYVPGCPTGWLRVVPSPPPFER